MYVSDGTQGVHVVLVACLEEGSDVAVGTADGNLISEVAALPILDSGRSAADWLHTSGVLCEPPVLAIC